MQDLASNILPWNCYRTLLSALSPANMAFAEQRSSRLDASDLDISVPLRRLLTRLFLGLHSIGNGGLAVELAPIAVVTRWLLHV